MYIFLFQAAFQTQYRAIFKAVISQISPALVYHYTLVAEWLGSRRVNKWPSQAISKTLAASRDIIDFFSLVPPCGDL